MADPKRVYSDEEVKSILSRAIDRQRAASPEGLSHDDLLSVGRDVGLSPEAIEAAAAEVTRGRAEQADEAAVRAERRSTFRIHLLTYVPVIAFLVFVNLMTMSAMTTPYPWVLWPALGWGLALALHARAALFPTDVEIAREVAKRTEKRRRIAEKRRRREAKSALHEGARELGHAVERGVAVILSETAKRIHEELDPVEDPRRVRVEEDRPGAGGRTEDERDEGDEDAGEGGEEASPRRAKR